MDKWSDLTFVQFAEERRIREAKGEASAMAAPAMQSEKTETIAGTNILRCVPNNCTATNPHIFVHGGGWVFGSSKQSLGIIRRIAEQSKRPVISIDYSLAPENKFPIAIDEVSNVIRSIANSSGIAGIIGASAGAQIAHHAMQNCSNIYISGAILFYGAFLQSTNSWSHKKYGFNKDGLTSTSMKMFIDAYDVPKDHLEKDLSLLPPLFLSVGSNDPLLADTLDLYTLLPKSNENVLEVIPAAEHGYINEWHLSNRIDRAISASVSWLEEKCN